MHVINTALLAYGMSGKYFHAPFLRAHPGFRLSGCWERSQQKITGDDPQAVSWPSLDVLLADPSIELVVVNTPNHTHFEYARAALLAGKHVLVEKAFTCTAAEAKTLMNLGRERGLQVAVYHNRRFDSDFMAVQQVLQSGRLGNLVEAELRFERFRPQPGPKLHKESPNPGAGLLKDLGPHLLDQACCLFGMPGAIAADLRCTRPGSQVDDWMDIRLYYEGVQVRLLSGMYMRFQQPAFVLHGTAGSFFKNRSDRQEADLVAGRKPGTPGWGEEPEPEWGTLYASTGGDIRTEKVPSPAGNYGLFYEKLYGAICHGTPLPVSAADGLRVMELIEAAQASYESGCQYRLS